MCILFSLLSLNCGSCLLFTLGFTWEGRALHYLLAATGKRARSVLGPEAQSFPLTDSGLPGVWGEGYRLLDLGLPRAGP